MEVFSWALIGLAAALVEEMTIPGNQERRVIGAMIIGIVCAMSGGFIAAQLGYAHLTSFGF